MTAQFLGSSWELHLSFYLVVSAYWMVVARTNALLPVLQPQCLFQQATAEPAFLGDTLGLFWKENTYTVCLLSSIWITGSFRRSAAVLLPSAFCLLGWLRFKNIVWSVVSDALLGIVSIPWLLFLSNLEVMLFSVNLKVPLAHSSSVEAVGTAQTPPWHPFFPLDE